MYPNDARMTSKGGKNKVHDGLQEKCVTDVLATFDVLPALSQYIVRTNKWNLFASCIVVFLLYFL